jgi:hypothetical protein
MMSIPEKTPFVHGTKIGSCCQLLRESAGVGDVPRHGERNLTCFVPRAPTDATERVSDRAVSLAHKFKFLNELRQSTGPSRESPDSGSHPPGSSGVGDGWRGGARRTESAAPRRPSPPH